MTEQRSTEREHDETTPDSDGTTRRTKPQATRPRTAKPSSSSKPTTSKSASSGKPVARRSTDERPSARKPQQSPKPAADPGSGPDGEREPQRRPQHDHGDRSDGHRPTRLRGRQVVVRAAEELMDLVGATPSGLVGMERTRDGWQVTLEVVEVERIPDTSSIMATYTVDLDDDGELAGYRRTGRYVRGRTGDG